MSAKFIKFPVTLAMDLRLTSGARTCYAVIVQLAYLEGRRREDDVVPSPPRSQVADVLRVSENTVRSYMSELASAGWIVERRASSGRPRQIQVFERSILARPQPVGKAVDNATTERPRAASPLTSKEDVLSKDRTSDCAVPSLSKIAGRNLAYDVVKLECGIVDRSPRAKEIPPALNGSRILGPGIRELYWHEIIEQAAAKGITASEVAERAADNPDGFEQAFAEAVAARCIMYRDVMEGAMLTPTSLRKWWSDLPAMLADKRDGSLLSRMRETEERLREGGE